MPDDVFERVARWWDRDALVTERLAVLAICGQGENDLHGSEWGELSGELRWRIVQAMRGLVRLADELRGVLK